MSSHHYILDEPKRRLIVALVTGGSSRRTAARYVGCAPSTITRTAARDPEFAAQLARAEQTAEINLLRSVQTASKMPKHWRAAAWLLERRNPEDFAARQPHLVTEQQMADIITHLIEVINEDLPEENYRHAMQTLDDMLLEMRNLHQPIGVEPIDGGPEHEASSSPSNPQASLPSPISGEGQGVRAVLLPSPVSGEGQGVRAGCPNPQSLRPNPLAHLTDATNPLKVEIDLRADEKDSTQDLATTSADTQRPNPIDAPQDCCTSSSPKGG